MKDERVEAKERFVFAGKLVADVVEVMVAAVSVVGE
jgi:hypothetical protein